MSRAAHFKIFAATLTLAVAAATSACDDDLDLPSVEPSPDSGAPTVDGGHDSSRDPDASLDGNDASPGAPDSGSDAEVDAGPTISSEVGVTGYVRLFNDAIFAEFYEDDTILRASNAPECVVHVRSQSKPASPAGTLTIGGPVVGATGGPPEAITVEPDPEAGNGYAFFILDPDQGGVFPSDDALQVVVESAGTDSFPAMAGQALRPPPAELVPVTAPATDAGVLTVDSTTSLPITWTAPATPQSGGRMIFEYSVIDGPASSKIASIFCSYPLSAGSAAIPANLLAEVRARIGAGAVGYLKVYAGGAKEVADAGVSYVLLASRMDAVGLDALDTELK